MVKGHTPVTKCDPCKGVALVFFNGRFVPVVLRRKAVQPVVAVPANGAGGHVSATVGFEAIAVVPSRAETPSWAGTGWW